MVRITSLLFLACSVNTGTAFTVPFQAAHFCNQKNNVCLKKQVISLHASEQTQQEKDIDYSNPSMKFGKPLDDDMKEFNKATVGFLKSTIFDTIYNGKDRDYARFYTLETIARVPYFSYLNVLHLYETLGKWRKANYLKIHFAESWNEMHHLLIMEELGGADKFIDRFIAQHIAVAYYWIVTVLYIWNPTMAYNVNEAVEEHAFSTYDNFIKENSDELKKFPAPDAAKKYYCDGDLYMFDEFQTGTCEPRRPKMVTLYDCFVAIRDDEAEHVKTMSFLQEDIDITVQKDEECEISSKIDDGVVAFE